MPNKVNVSFKKGSESNLWDLQTSKSIVDGAFYLTTDTHRLYIGQEVTEGNNTETKLFSVNEGVITVATLDNLPNTQNLTSGNAGNFYYVSGSNILCVYNGTQWVQINPDTNTYIDEADWALISNSKSIQLVLGIHDSNNTIDAPKINFVGDGVTVSKDATTKDITVDIDPDLEVTWTASEGSSREKLAVDLGDGGFSLIGGQNIALTKSQEGNNVTISATDMRPTGATISPKRDLENHYIDGYDVVVNMPSGTTSATSFDPKVKIDSTTNYLHFQGDVLDLSGTYYTQAEVNEKIRDFNAVEYKGVWPPIGDLSWDSTNPYPTTSENVKNGSMYLVRLDGAPALPGGEVPKVGDLIIAQGTEGASGYLTNITWVRIPSGDEAQVDTTYSFSMNGESSSVGVNVSSTAGGTTNSNEMFKIKEGNKIKVTRDTTNSPKEIVVSHEPLGQNDFTASTPTYAINNEGKVSILTGVSKDAYGHLTGTTTVDMPAPIEVNGFSSSASIDGNIATITTSLNQKFIGNSTSYGTAKNATFNITGQGLDVTANTSTNTVTLSLTWGEF